MDFNASCPNCQSNKYKNPNLELLVNDCGHPLCRSCVESLFFRGQAPCPDCGAILKKASFRGQLFADSYVEKETEIRRRLTQEAFNFKEDDFATLAEFNDYLEMSETLIFNLANDIDVKETKEKIELWKEENKTKIKRNKYRLSSDEELIDATIKAERELHQTVLRENLALKEEKDAKMRNEKKSLLTELTYSEMPAEMILAKHLKETSSSRLPLQPTATGANGVDSGNVDMTPLNTDIDDLSLCDFGPSLKICDIDLEGCYPPTPASFFAGGYSMEEACVRYLQSAFDCLCMPPVVESS